MLEIDSARDFVGRLSGRVYARECASIGVGGQPQILLGEPAAPDGRGGR
ncbi:MAG TPA: hypothetical protein VF553_19445 [Pyrinomonadaceae bacterium]